MSEGRKAFDTIELFAEMLHEEKISKQYDRVIPVVGDEGKGKSTFMLEFSHAWKKAKGEKPTAENVLDQVVWNDRDELKTALAEYEPRSVIPVMDAGRVLHKKNAMAGEQVEVEKDLLDVRMKEYVILLGFQSWDIIPSMIQKRRAKNLFYIPTRGTVWGYDRSTIDDRVNSDSWPSPNLKDGFPSLEGTDIWEEFKRRDRKQKEQRMNGNENDGSEDDETLSLREIVEEIKQNGVADFVSVNPGNKQPYIDPDLIEYHYGLSARQAKKAKKVLAKDPDVVVPEEPPEA